MVAMPLPERRLRLTSSGTPTTQADISRSRIPAWVKIATFRWLSRWSMKSGRHDPEPAWPWCDRQVEHDQVDRKPSHPRRGSPRRDAQDAFDARDDRCARSRARQSTHPQVTASQTRATPRRAPRVRCRLRAACCLRRCRGPAAGRRPGSTTGRQSRGVRSTSRSRGRGAQERDTAQPGATIARRCR